MVLWLRKSVRVHALFVDLRVFPKGHPTPQSGDAHRSPKFRLRRNRGASLWTAVGITALTQEVGFSHGAEASKKCPSSRPFCRFDTLP